MSKKSDQKKEMIIKQKFQKLSQEVKPKPKLLKNCINAFWVGGLICVLGQFILNTLISFGITKDDGAAILSIIMVFLGALLTGIGIYDKIASFAGAGTVVPITGFANSIVSPAIEFKKEGFVFGVAAKMFTIGGPVLVYGIGTSVIIGIIYYIFGVIL
ncbi:stage V sporulation protein AC [Clostridium fallax]|uniref:Stage V sporulation protein AC n=1 Tax=Clostridium fallax TaxID=1533 RepID=A0A1M4UHJ5_9CLOT|nr:stage V sporulation protein AC [Clostridium fallax]SHE56226.1 stage V sporulation protein AC [Clostridium fallax]SQB07568.1 stage V sporulation protein AC [Clostridium fallax]